MIKKTKDYYIINKKIREFYDFKPSNFDFCSFRQYGGDFRFAFSFREIPLKIPNNFTITGDNSKQYYLDSYFIIYKEFIFNNLKIPLMLIDIKAYENEIDPSIKIKESYDSEYNLNLINNLTRQYLDYFNLKIFDLLKEKKYIQEDLIKIWNNNLII
tara:strand:- start:10428 stop:10898 length:471 start_codon:yes stop_codon:yes gene_type:complete